MQYYQNVINITQSYLGPAAQRFVDRQIGFNFDKLPQDLNKDDLPKIANSVGVAIGLLTQDKKMVLEVEQKILALSA